VRRRRSASFIVQVLRRFWQSNAKDTPKIFVDFVSPEQFPRLFELPVKLAAAQTSGLVAYF
jgi:hypothetical protein